MVTKETETPPPGGFSALMEVSALSALCLLGLENNKLPQKTGLFLSS